MTESDSRIGKTSLWESVLDWRWIVYQEVCRLPIARSASNPRAARYTALGILACIEFMAVVDVLLLSGSLHHVVGIPGFRLWGFASIGLLAVTNGLVLFPASGLHKYEMRRRKSGLETPPSGRATVVILMVEFAIALLCRR